MTRILERRIKALEDLNSANIDFDGLTSSVAELNILDGVTATFTDLNLLSAAAAAAAVGAVAGTGVACAIRHFAGYVELDFTFTNVAVTWTDAGAGGASGSIKIFDFVEGAWQSLGSRSNLTFASDTTMDVAGDLAMVYAFGSVAANAGDAALTGTEVDFVPISGTVTFSANAATSATLLKAAGAAVVDGTATASDYIMNFSGSAATSDANGVLTVNGTHSVRLIKLGDD